MIFTNEWIRVTLEELILLDEFTPGDAWNIIKATIINNKHLLMRYIFDD